VIDENAAGVPKTKSRCKLPVYEPRDMGGLLNRNAVRAAAARLVQAAPGVAASTAQRVTAARRLVELYAVIGEAPPRSLTDLAGLAPPQLPATGSWGALEM
jgi:hypothetical protein